MSQEGTAAGFRKLEMLQKERGANLEKGSCESKGTGGGEAALCCAQVKPADLGHFPSQQRTC